MWNSIAKSSRYENARRLEWFLSHRAKYITSFSIRQLQKWQMALKSLNIVTRLLCLNTEEYMCKKQVTDDTYWKKKSSPVLNVHLGGLRESNFLKSILAWFWYSTVIRPYCWQWIKDNSHRFRKENYESPECRFMWT